MQKLVVTGSATAQISEQDCSGGLEDVGAIPQALNSSVRVAGK